MVKRISAVARYVAWPLVMPYNSSRPGALKGSLSSWVTLARLLLEELLCLCWLLRSAGDSLSRP